MTSDELAPTRNGKSRKFVWFLFGLAFLLAAAIVFTFTANHSYLKDQIETRVSEALGRKLTIGDALSIEIGDSIDVRANNVTLAAPEWSQQQNLLEVDAVSISLELASLFSGPLQFNFVDVRGIRVYGERNDSGEDNWSFDFGEEVETEPLARQDIPVRLTRLQIDDSRLEYRRPDSTVLTIGLQQLVQQVADDNSVSAAVNGDINGTLFNLDLGVNDVRNLTALRDIELAIDGNIGEVTFNGEVGLEDALDPSRPSLRFQLSGPNVEYLTDVFELPRVTTGALNLSIDVKPADARMAVTAQGTFGEFDLDASGFFDDLQTLQDAELSAAAKGPNAAVIAKLAGVRDFPAQPFDVAADLKKNASALQINNFRATVGATTLAANANFIDLPKLDGATATLRFQTPEIGRFDAVTGLDGQLTGPMAIDADLSAAAGTGATIVGTAQAMAGQMDIDGVLVRDLVGSYFDVALRFDDSTQLLNALGVDASDSRPLSMNARLTRQPGAISIESGDAKFGADTLSFSALLDDQLMEGSNELELSLQSENLRALLSAVGLAGMEDVPEGPLSLQGSLETSAELITLQRFAATLAGNEVDIKGSVKPASGGIETRLDVGISGSNLASLLPSSDATVSLDKPYQLNAKLVTDATRLAITDIDAKLDQSSLSGAITVGLEPLAESLSVDIEARSPNLIVLLPPSESLNSLQNVPLSAVVRASRANKSWTADNVSVNVGDARINIKGQVGAWPELADTALDVEANSPDVSQLASLVGVTLPADPANANFRVVSANNGVNFEEFEINLGASDVRGNLTYTFAEVPNVDLKIRSRLLDLTHLLPDDGAAEEDENAPTGPAPTRLIPNTPIPYEELRKFNASVDVRIDKLNHKARKLSELVLVGNIKDGELRVENAAITGAHGGKLHGRMGLRPVADQAELWMRLFGENVEVGLPAETQEELERLPRYDLMLAFITTGTTVSEMAGAANGYLKLTSGAGRLRFGLMNTFSQDFMAELLDTVNPFAKKDPYTNMQCMVVLATVEDGKVHGDPVMVMQSERLKVVARSSINLKTEALDADINTVAQKGIGISLGDLVNPYIKVGGTLAKPVLQLDKQSAFLEGGAAVATGGISILAKSLKGRFLESGDPCATALADAEVRFAELEAKYGAKRAVQ